MTLVLVIPVVHLFVSQTLMDHGLSTVLLRGVSVVQSQKRREYMLEFRFTQIGSKNKLVLDHQ